MNWLVLLYFLEIGYAPLYSNLNTINYAAYPEVSYNMFYVNLNAEVVVKDILFVGGGVKTYLQTTNKINDNFPFEVDYIFNMGLRLDNIELGFRHFCLHPVRPYESYFSSQSFTDAWYEELYIRISSEF